MREAVVIAHAIQVARSLAYLVDGTGEEGSIAGVQLSTANDDKSKPEGQAEGTVQKLLQTRVRRLNLQAGFHWIAFTTSPVVVGCS